MSFKGAQSGFAYIEKEILYEAKINQNTVTEPLKELQEKKI